MQVFEHSLHYPCSILPYVHTHFITIMLFFSLHFLPCVHYSFHYNYVVFLPTLSFIPFGGLVRQLSQSKCQLSQSMYRLRANALCRNGARARTTIWSIWMAPRTWSLSVTAIIVGIRNGPQQLQLRFSTSRFFIHDHDHLHTRLRIRPTCRELVFRNPSLWVIQTPSSSWESLTSSYTTIKSGFESPSPSLSTTTWQSVHVTLMRLRTLRTTLHLFLQQLGSPFGFNDRA